MKTDIVSCAGFFYSTDSLLCVSSECMCSLFIDFNHAEAYCFVYSSFVIASKDHDFVAWKAESLLFRHFQNLVKQAGGHTLYRKEYSVR